MKLSNFFALKKELFVLDTNRVYSKRYFTQIYIIKLIEHTILWSL